MRRVVPCCAGEGFLDRDLGSCVKEKMLPETGGWRLERTRSLASLEGVNLGRIDLGINPRAGIPIPYVPARLQQARPDPGDISANPVFSVFYSPDHSLPRPTRSLLWVLTARDP